MKKLLMAIIFFSFSKCYGQIDEFRRLIEVVFYEPKVYEKIFFSYKLDQSYNSRYSLREGTYAFINPNTTLKRIYPNVMDELSLSLATENKLLTITFITNSQGSVLITDHIMDSNIKLLTVIDTLSIEESKAYISLYTTSWGKADSLTDRFVRINSTLVNNRNRWHIKKLKITPIECRDCSRPRK